MKNQTLITPFITAIFLLFIACDKNSPIPIAEEETGISYLDSLDALTDSCFFEIGGVEYNFRSIGQEEIGNEQVNIRRDSIGKDGVTYYSGSKDSTMFTRSCTFVSNNDFIEFRFLRIYNKIDLYKKPNTGTFLFVKEDSTFFKVGKQIFPYDYTRTNTMSGTALNMHLIGEDHTYKTHTSQSLGIPTNLNNNSQINSYFEIKKFEKLKGAYFVEGIFTTNVFNYLENEPFKVKKGYFRFKFRF